MTDIPPGVSIGLWVLNEACGLAHCDVTVSYDNEGIFAVMKVKHNRTKGEIRERGMQARPALEKWLKETHELEAKG